MLAAMRRTFRLGDLVLCHVTADTFETRFPSGAVCAARFDDTPEARATADALGYGDDVWQLHADHDLLHSLLAHAQGQPYSPTLAHVAGVCVTPDAVRAAEEGLVTAFQRYVMTGAYDPQLDVLDDPRGLRAVFCAAFRLRKD